MTRGMGGGLGRNDPCWCGSGKKFKKCHLRRDQDIPGNPYETLKKLKEYNRKRVCLHPESGPSNCSEKIIKAHTIQRGRSLKQISEDGHVLGFATDAASLNKTNGQIDVKPFGTKTASTFNGFCSYHDNETFAPLEDGPFRATAEHCFLLGYRALCRELYQKATALDAMEFLRLQDQGRQPHEQLYWQHSMDRVESGQNAGYRDLIARKKSFDAVLLKRSFCDAGFFAVETQEIPDVMASFGVTVQFDFQGTRLQDLSDLDKRLESIYVSIIAGARGGAIVFSWLTETTGASEAFVRSLNEFRDEDLPDSIVRLVFEHSENTYFRPRWWRSLGDGIRNALLNRITRAVDLRVQRNPMCLRPDGNSYVSWTVLDRKTSLQL